MDFKKSDKTDRYEKEAPDMPAREECSSFPVLPGYTLFNHMDMLLAPSCAGWLKGAKGKLASRSEQKGWIKFKDDRPGDVLSLGQRHLGLWRRTWDNKSGSCQAGYDKRGKTTATEP